MKKECAEHAYYSHVHDEVTDYDAFPATIQKLDEDENLPEDTTAQDDQEDETEHSLSETLQTRRQISKIHENMEHPSNRVLRLGGAKRRFILAAARHRCGDCEAQKRPARPIVSRSPTSFVFNDVVGLDLFFLNTYEKHTLGHWSATCYSPAGSVERNLEERIQKELVEVIRKASHLFCRPAAQPVLRHFCGKNGKRWDETRSDTAGGTVEEWQDRTCGQGLEGRLLQDDTRTDFEEDCDAVNQATASKINDSGKSAYQRVFGKNPPQMEDAVLECGGADLGVVSRQQTGELAQERLMTMRRIAPQASLALDHKRRWKGALHHAAKHYKGELHVGQPLWFYV